MAGQQADDDHQHGGDEDGHAVVPAVEVVVAQRAGDGGQRIDVLAQNGGGGQAHHVPEHTAAHTGEHAQKHAEKDVIPKAGIDGVLNTDDGENSQTGGIEKAPFRLDEQIRQVMVGLEPVWGPKDLQLELELAPLRYVGSESLLYHVWSNLISNAVKFSPEGGVLTVSLRQEGQQVFCSITDRGPGMSADVQRHIFDKFYQGDSSRRQEGSGLGLPLVKRIVQLCGGSITVESTPGVGSTFTVTLPA